MTMEDLNNWQDKFEECYYSKKLLCKITDLNNLVKASPVNIIEIKKAIYYAKKYHGTQTRKSGEPFYSHPIEVACMVANYAALENLRYFNSDLIITSILHDTIEDTSLTKEMIAKIFNRRIAEMVSMLSKTQGKTIRELVNIAFRTKNLDVLLIKLFDREHNVITLNFTNKEKQYKKSLETINIFLTLSLYLDIGKVKKVIESNCYRIIDPSYKKHDSPFNDMYQLPFLAAQNGF